MVKECGRRSATGGVRGLFLSIGSVALLLSYAVSYRILSADCQMLQLRDRSCLRHSGMVRRHQTRNLEILQCEIAH
jgi:hypothetical protein